MSYGTNIVAGKYSGWRSTKYDTNAGWAVVGENADKHGNNIKSEKQKQS